MSYTPTVWLTAEEAAGIAGVVPRTVHDWVRRGDLPGRLISRKTGYRIKAADLDAFLEGKTAIVGAKEALKRQGKTNAHNFAAA